MCPILLKKFGRLKLNHCISSINEKIIIIIWKDQSCKATYKTTWDCIVLTNKKSSTGPIKEIKNLEEPNAAIHSANQTKKKNQEKNWLDVWLNHTTLAIPLKSLVEPWIWGCVMTDMLNRMKKATV